MALRHTVMGILLWLLRIGLATTFVWAGTIKALDPSQFVADIDSYDLVPYRLAILVALYLPWLEILCGVCILIPRLSGASLVILTALTIVFLAAIASAWLRGLDISCGCFGAGNKPASYPWLLLRDLGLLAAILFVAIWHIQDRRRLAYGLRIAKSTTTVPSPFDAEVVGIQGMR